MGEGTLIVSRSLTLFPQIKQRFEELGFQNVEVTGEEKDSLNGVIREMQPRLLIVGSSFYQAGTPYMMGQLLKLFPKLHIVVVNVGSFPDHLAVWFIWRRVKSYVNLHEGFEEFHRALQEVRRGRAYIAPNVQRLMDDFPEWPRTPNKITDRQMEVLILICNGFIAEHIASTLHISRATVNYILDKLYKTFHVNSREELIRTAFVLKLVTEKDLVFHDRKATTKELPEWAAAKQRMNKGFSKSKTSKQNANAFL
ncbi:MAG: LuxR C-terminal-related transcriptional regulator [Treponema sp.]|nr:LuxR C-terminal-related transcriptional regulator [Treponema sp.]